MAKVIHFLFITTLVFSQVVRVMADSQTEAFDFFQEEAKVVTASRREESIKDIPVAVDVITAEEIKASGATNIWDLMRFRVGLDVLDMRSIDGRRGIVSVRGVPQEFVNNLQVLLDGRSVYEPISSGVHWDQLPINMEDIERIEIIRGPNAALYGSGAGLGVINILTKKPQGPTQMAIRALGGSQGTVQTAASVESAAKNFAYRASYGFRQQNGFPPVTGDDGNDFLHSNKANARTHWALAAGSELEFFTGATWENTGMLNNADRERVDFDSHFMMLKFAQTFGAHSTVEILSSRNSVIEEQTPVYPYQTQQWNDLQYDQEILHRIKWWENRLHTTYGINYRHAKSQSPTIFVGHPVQNKDLWSVYFNQAIELSPTLSLSGGVSRESSDVGAGEPKTNYQVASLWSMVENHALRASHAVAHTIPSLFSAGANDRFSAVVTSVGNPDLKPQRVTAYEVGYRGSSAEKHLQLNAGVFYTVIDDMNVTSARVTSFAPFAIELNTLNSNQAIARGAETEVKYRFSRSNSVYLNYTYEHFTDRVGDEGTVTENTPAHKVNFGGVADLTHGFSGSVNVGYKDHYFITSAGRTASAAIPAYWRLDARIAYAVNSSLELFMAAQNLAANTHTEFPDGLVVPRTYQGGVSLKFGGQKE